MHNQNLCEDAGTHFVGSICKRILNLYECIMWETNQQYIHIEQDRQCIYNVNLRCVHATIVAVAKQKVLHNLNAYL